MYNSLHLMFGQPFVPSWFKLNSPVESRPQVRSGVPEPVEQTWREVGSAAAAVGSDLDVASLVSPQLSQQHKGTRDLFYSCQHASHPGRNQAWRFTASAPARIPA